ncbi:PA14 domain-containing protein [Salarchaeum japonicum]|uniref:PA14 domain-containing protein n=1 Tax=Salarchaeum japonicum TaxID=555573 RepID=A0AAV3SZ16_9EURY|nr:PA14 domain-containing protein [Salarchaeum japonicum]
MRLLEDERGVTVQIGAILMFAILVILLSTYQAYVVPQENEAIEFQHSQAVESDLVAVRNSVLSAAGSGGGRPESVALGTQYPVRTFFVNPPSATGTLQTETVGNATLSVANVTVTDDEETAQFFTRQNNSLSYPTKSLVYDAQYNVYGGAPSRVLENGLLYNDFADVHTVPAASNQVLVDGETITLVALNGSYFQNGVTASAVDPSVLSGPYNPVDVTNTTGNVTITFSSRMPAAEWRNRTSLGTQEHVVSVTQAGENEVQVVLEGGVEYTLRAAKIGVGSQTVDTEAAYITRVGNDTVRVGDPVTFEVRDEYNNPVPNADVSVSGGDVVGSRDKSTGSDGRVTYEFSAVSSSARATIGDDSDDADRVEFDVAQSTAGNGTVGGTYNLRWDTEWMEANNPGLGVAYYSENNTLVVNTSNTYINASTTVSTSSGGSLSGVLVDYATENTSVADFPDSENRTSDSRSIVQMYVNPGETRVHATASVGGDELAVKVTRPATPQPGGTYFRYYEGDYTGSGSYMPNFEAQTAVADGNASTFDIDAYGGRRTNGYGYNFTASIAVPEDGTYTFATTSDDGSRLYIDGQLVVDNAGDHSVQKASGDVYLTAGQHDITVTYYDNTYDEEGNSEPSQDTLEVTWAGPGFAEAEIPESVLTPRVPAAASGGPSAALSITMTDDGPGNSADTYELDASGSTGDITEYRWDFDNDGTIDETTTSPTTTTQHQPNSRPANARVVVVGPNGQDAAVRSYSGGTTAAVTTYPSAFKDGDGSTETNEDPSIPPQNAYGDLSGFGNVDVDSNDNQVVTISSTDYNGTIGGFQTRVGIAVESLPSRSQHTLVIGDYRMSSGQGFDVTPVTADGTALGQTYSLQSGSTTTRTIQLSQSVVDYINSGGTLYLRVEAQTNAYSGIRIDYIQVESSDQ